MNAPNFDDLMKEADPPDVTEEDVRRFLDGGSEPAIEQMTTEEITNYLSICLGDEPQVHAGPEDPLRQAKTPNSGDD